MATDHDQVIVPIDDAPRAQRLLTLEFGSRAEFEDRASSTGGCSPSCWARSCSSWSPPAADAARQGTDQPGGRGRRPRADGAGDHPVHGRGLRRSPEPGVSLAFRARGLSVAQSRATSSSAARSDAGVSVPARRVRQHRAPRRHLAGSGVSRLAGAADGDRAHRGPRQRFSGLPRRRRTWARSARWGSAVTSRSRGCGRPRSAARR